MLPDILRQKKILGLLFPNSSCCSGVFQLLIQLRGRQITSKVGPGSHWCIL